MSPQIFIHIKLTHDSLGHQATRNHGGGHSGAGMRAGSHEVQISIMRMPVGRSKVSHLSQRMRQPVC